MREYHNRTNSQKTAHIQPNKSNEYKRYLSNARGSTGSFNPYDIKKPKYIYHAEVKAKESSYNPITQTFRDQELESFMKTQDVQNDNQLKKEQIYNILNHENRLKGLESQKNYPKDKQWKPRYVKNTRQDHNIISNLLLTEHHFDSPDKRPLPENKVILKHQFIQSETKQGKKIVKTLSTMRDFDILSNKYLNQAEERSRQEQQDFLIKAANKYWKNHILDPICQTYYNTDREKEIMVKEQLKRDTHMLNYLKRLPVSLQKEGAAYNVLSNEPKDIGKVQEIDMRMKNRIQRFEVKQQYESMARQRSMLMEDEGSERKQNKISYDRFKQTNERGFDIVTHNDFSQSPNSDKKNSYYQMCQKPRPWNYITKSENVSRFENRKDSIDPGLTASPVTLKGFNTLRRNQRIIEKQNESLSSKRCSILTGGFNIQ